MFKPVYNKLCILQINAFSPTSQTASWFTSSYNMNIVDAEHF